MSDSWKMRSWLVSSTAALLLAVPFRATAQMTPDATLPNNSEVNTSNNTTTISGGTRVGDNLYHSLSQFSIPTGGTASFDNASDIQNIFTRVTGANASNIDGLIRANGSANLFLLNPNGIIFGANARLNIGGSFIGSTASSINFADGNNFPAQPQQTQPLLSVNVPLGLQFGRNNGAIQVNGEGNQITPNVGFSPTRANNSSAGLSVQPGKTLALVGSNVGVLGGTIAAEGGRVDLGSVGSGSVSLQSANQGWTLGYEGVPNYQDIQISQQALVNASGSEAGAIQIHGASVNISDGSLIWLQNSGSNPSGSLSVNATESLVLRGVSPNGNISSSVLTETVNAGKGGDLVVDTPRLVLQDGARVAASTYSNAPGGNVVIHASDSVQLLQNSAVNPSRPGIIISYLGTGNYASGNAGSVELSTKQLTAMDGGTVASSTFGTGVGGNVIVNADFIEMIGVNQERAAPSSLGATTSNAGDAGSVKVNTSQLQLKDGGTVYSSSLATGNAGSIDIKASDSVQVSGEDPTAPSTISSSVIIGNESFRRIFGIPAVPSGLGGNVSINTPRLDITSGGLVSVRNEGTGDGGRLQITADNINLNDSGSITAATASGNGGNITVNSRQLGLRRSEITATAGNNGNGGNINIDTDNLTGTSDSRIIADAQQGTGGNININAQGFFFPRQNISASSRLGINGNIQIQSLNQTIVNELVELPQAPVDASNQIVAGCPGTQPNASSSFTITGTGGLPDDPFKPLSEQIVMHDMRSPSQMLNRSTKPETRNVPAMEDIDSSHNNAPQPLVEATGWAIGSKGEVILTADAAGASWSKQASCHGL